MAQLWKMWMYGWSWQLSPFSLEMMRWFGKRAQLEGDEVWLGPKALP